MSRHQTPAARHQTPAAAELPDAPRGGPISQYHPTDVDDLTSVDVQRALETNNVGLLHDWVERLRARTIPDDLTEQLEETKATREDMESERDGARKTLAEVADLLDAGDVKAALRHARWGT